MIVWCWWFFNILYINLSGLVTCMQMEEMVYTNTCVLLEMKSHFLTRGNLIQVRLVPEYLKIII